MITTGARWVHIGAAWLFVAGVLLQGYLAGAALAQLGGSGDFGTHIAVGYTVMGLLALAVLLSGSRTATCDGFGISAGWENSRSRTFSTPRSSAIRCPFRRAPTAICISSPNLCSRLMSCFCVWRRMTGEDGST